MSKQYLVLFQHGPVQEFIATARRTDDFWAGSYLLSHATEHVVHEIKSRLNGEVIFPDPGVSVSGDFEAALPNRVAAIVNVEENQDIKSLLTEIKESVRKALIHIFSAVEKDVTGNVLFSERQVDGFLEFFFVFVSYDDKDHAICYARAQTKLEARKNIRDFRPSFEYGFKCTQCGSREPLRGSTSLDAESTALPVLRKYWKDLRSGRNTYSFKEKEMLCAVCCGKRLLRRIYCKKSGGIPSTSTVAVGAWIDENRGLFDDSLARDFVALLKKSGVRWKCTPVTKNRVREENNFQTRPTSSYLNEPLDEQTAKPLLRVDGDFFFPETYERFADEVVNGFQKHLAGAKGILSQLLNNDKLVSPPRYLAVVIFDADNMGDVLRRMRSKKDHQELTRKLTEFSAVVRQICHKEFHGHIIYVGGDEGAVLLPLSEMLQVMDRLREAFAECMKPVSESVNQRLTLSAGAAVIHHQSPLGQGIRTAQEAIEKAKAVRNKNAFAVTILKRSGSLSHAIAPWSVDIDGHDLFLVAFLQKWFDLYQDRHLSPRWFYQARSLIFHAKSERGNRYQQDIAAKLLFRILPRHATDIRTALELATETERLMTKSETELMDFGRLVDLLYLPLYLFQGGDQ